ncbi:molybdenum ABC transporter ATP-binding protein [Defluviimonas sp. WL0050]|uniref:Molybdenum ABC transporter ATP-binding protein n=1 Tax=Albidovulum litorale TaxID=2984134 RepID=A0ABT2ZI75_9RHOB|nr:molybdenum ABC transporter ATP-binding protein [Defluviimonas sp. WL0050]MCV2870821.1 molybdenum ABC transporter ATP-binding protein [Defluviimonas sp. WL0050]
MKELVINVALQRDDLKIEIDERLPLSGLTAIFGPSGAGKTTLLRLIAGFERGIGEMRFGDEVWQQGRHFTPPYHRRVATVFQQPRLFDHLDVAGNLAYAARRAGQMGAVAGMVERFALDPLLSRRPETLSGGEAQRVALARALLTAPRLVLMDEPVTALDQARRNEILPFIESLRDEANVPILYVSHSLAEVTRLATQILTLAEGRVTGHGPAGTILPHLAATPDQPGEEPGGLITARVAGMSHDGLCELHFSGGTILSPGRVGPDGAEVRLIIRARDVMLSRDRPVGLSALNILPATVTSVVPVGAASAHIGLDCGGTALAARITMRSVAALELVPGASCHAILKSVALAREALPSP